MGYGSNNYLKIQNFLDLALTSSAPNALMEKTATAVYGAFAGNRNLTKRDLPSLIKLQLLLQKLCKFELALHVRDMLPIVVGLDAVAHTKILIDNLNPPTSAYSLIPSMRSKKDFLSILSIMNLTCTLYSGNSITPVVKRETDSSIKFSNRIAGKKIAIVGPANIGIDRGAEIDGYDVVVRMNIKGDNALPNFNSHGKRTDVVYLNGIWSNRFEIPNYRDLLNSSCHFVWRTNKRPALVPNAHSLLRIDNLEISGSFLMLPRVITDLLRFKPSSVTIFHTDFYTGERIYERNFRSEKNAQEIWQLADHDLLTSLRFINFLVAMSRTPINFVDLEFGETSLDLMSFSRLIQRRAIS